MTTIYSTTMAVASFTPPLVAVPVADASSWRFSLGMWAVFAASRSSRGSRCSCAQRSAAADEDIEPPNPQVFGRMWRLPLAWALAVGFLAAGTIAYTSFAWLPQLLVDTAGVTPAAAGALLSLFAAMGLPASLLVPLLVTRYNATRALFGVAVVTGLAGIAGLLFAPQAAPWLWVVLLGLEPLLFPLTLVLLGLRTRTHEGSVALSGFVQSIGYAIVALFPFGIGLLHGATGLVDGAAHRARRRGRGRDPRGRRRGASRHDRGRVGAPARRLVTRSDFPDNSRYIVLPSPS